MSRVRISKTSTTSSVSPAGAPDRAAFPPSTSEEVLAALQNAVRVTKAGAEKAVKKAPESVEEAGEELKPTITNVVSVPPELEAAFRTELVRYQDLLVKHLLSCVVPYEAALENAVIDAQESVMIITGASNVSLSLGRAHNIITNVLPEVKSIRMLAQAIGLSDEDTDSAVNLYFASLMPKK